MERFLHRYSELGYLVLRLGVAFLFIFHALVFSACYAFAFLVRFEFNIPPGKFYPRNITPDPETGIGRFSDGEIARALRYGVGRDGRALLPFMEMQGLSDEDLTAVVSYLRSQPPVRNDVPAHHFTLLGMIVKATVLANPVGPKQTPPTANPQGATVENGRYIVESVANCWSCHTQRDTKTGAMVGPHLGGATMSDEVNLKRTWAPPNLTGDPTTGRLAKPREVVNGALFKGLPFPDADRIVALVSTNALQRQPLQPIASQDLAVYQERQTAFERLGAYAFGPVNLATGDGRPERFAGGQLTVAAFDALGV